MDAGQLHVQNGAVGPASQRSGLVELDTYDKPLNAVVQCPYDQDFGRILVC